MLPFRQAIKLPFDFYYKVRFESLAGKIRLNVPTIRRGMIKIGAQGSDMFSHSPVVIDLRGVLVLEGRISIGTGTLIRIENKGKLEMEDNVVIGARSILFCENSIIIKRGSITSWDCQIMDTDTHSIVDIKNNKILDRSGPVTIGERCWLGNKVMINKGTTIPNDTIVASNSLCNKDYKKLIPPFSIIGGIPAKILSENKKMFCDKL